MPSYRSDLVDVAGILIGETEKAYKADCGTGTIWLPKSQVEWDPDDKTFAMPEWLAKEKGVI